MKTGELTDRRLIMTGLFAVFLAVSSLGPSIDALAQGVDIRRVDATTLSCIALQDVIDAEGAVIVRSRSSRSGQILSERYVSRRGFCLTGEITRFRSVSTRDVEYCSVKLCTSRPNSRGTGG
ncbi:MAG: hypothetical protein AAGF59_08055 [Pseudomonadota bacterium]